jgi:uncharacterized protein
MENGDGFVNAPIIGFAERLQHEIDTAGGELALDPIYEGAVGATMFDLPNSEDGTLTVLLSSANIQRAPSQSLVRVTSVDGKHYLGMVTQGPFAEPDSLRGDSHMLVTVATRGGIYLPPYHGRVQVTILGEEQSDGTLRPPLLRPLPNSPVHVLDDEAAARVLGPEGDIRLGLAANYQDLEIRVPSDNKQVLPRHTAILGTTGAGKSTTVARLMQQAQAAGMAVILLDVEGEYTFVHEPTDDPRMVTALGARRLPRVAVPAERTTLYHLVGRETANEEHPNLREFSLQFARLSPYALIEILDLSDAQQERFLRAYDIAKGVLRDLKIFPREGHPEEERIAMEIDEFERGYPRITLQLLMDVVGACLAQIEKSELSPYMERLQSPEGLKSLRGRVQAAQIPAIPVSWRALLGKLSRLNRLKVFDVANTGAHPLRYDRLLQPGEVSIVDLSDSGMSELSNIVIADLLHGVQEAQDDAYEAFEKAKREGRAAPAPARVLLIIEEAHEFLSSERIEKMPTLLQQVARIAKRGRKRWLGLVFVTQLPQHLPRQVFGLVNSYILHKITDPQVVSALQRTVSGIDEGLWRKLPGLAPGQAIVSFPHMTLPLLVAMDPTPAKLRLVE